MESSTKKTIGISALSTFIGMLLVLGGINILEDEAYYCEARGIVMPCDSLSQYYGLPNGKCWNSELGNKLCRSGWLLGVNDDVPLEEPEPSEPIQKPYVPYYEGEGEHWSCNSETCVPCNPSPKSCIPIK